MQLNWINTTDRKPENNKRVYVIIENENGKQFQSMAIYVSKHKILAEDFFDD